MQHISIDFHPSLDIFPEQLDEKFPNVSSITLDTGKVFLLMTIFFLISPNFILIEEDILIKNRNSTNSNCNNRKKLEEDIDRIGMKERIKNILS